MFTPQILRPVTSADVAREAGVSRATVSVVLNGKTDARVSAATRQRVTDTAARMGYLPNVRARALRTGDSSDIVIPLSSLEQSSELAPLLQAFLDDAGARGFDAHILLGHQPGGASAAAEWALRRPKGVVALARDCDAAATAVLRSVGVQGLIVISHEPIDYAPCLVLDQQPLAHAALTHLAGRGYTHYAYLRPPGPDTGADARHEALQQEIAASGTQLSVVRGGHDPASLRDWAAAWRYDPHPPQAIICHDDMLAFAAIHALHAVGVSVPGDVSVIGQGNNRVAASFVPGLTTVWRDLRPVAGQLLDALVDMFSAQVISRIPTPPAQLLVRESA